ncbi:galactokinase [Anaerosacchariphilus polymeriproducens]|uniref:Galactokinase n=1 Tax=Anaerosacchariphilus polymeriproducens TaxID=1812858 RepID=A0A371AWT7_9FIRM|nr:galactokinase [Anaerosacchariphilus polymeriproducens]RDU24009.1 galactokinase [Anaerosacchariphilus polymeriproducens]
MKEKLIREFKNIFKEEEGIRLFFAPGRVNLIGEHTDYNGGHVFPCALNIGTYAAVKKRDDNKLRFFSGNFAEFGIIESSLEDLLYKKEALWTNYPKGVLWALNEKGFKIETGFDMYIWGNIPNGSGLSSSASVEVLTGYACKNLYGCSITLAQIAHLAQYAENKFNGVNCGIMDQFACAMGKKDNAIFLNTNNLSFEYLPFKLENSKIVIACSNKKRGLGESQYNKRREECEKALIDIQRVKKADSLGSLTEEEFEEVKEYIKDPICRKRARHAVYENQRTLRAVNALKARDIKEFGRLMKESHISLRDDYEVTGIELDTLVQSAWEIEGVVGARMTGAGFGGCTVNIVENQAVDTFIEKVGTKYFETVGYRADFYTVDVGGGPTEL